MSCGGVALRGQRHLGLLALVAVSTFLETSEGRLERAVEESVLNSSSPPDPRLSLTGAQPA